jgi:F-type H+-transporting ATPase subunit b
MFDAAFWVAMAFVGFIGVIIYYKLPGTIAGKLDERADNIRKELDEARAVREEAQSLLASYQRKQRDAVSEANEIIDHANQEAERLTAETDVQLAETLERRTQLAVDKIAQAEAEAVNEVRDVSVDVAVAAATNVIRDQMDDARANDQIEKSVTELRARLPQA